MKIQKKSFSIRLLNNIRRIVLFQLVFIGIAMSTYSYFSFASELKATERLIQGQLMTSLTKMLDYGEILYIQPLLESTVKASEGRFKVYVTVEKSSNSDQIAFSGDSSVLEDIFKLQLATKQFAPYFGEIQVGLTIGYSDQVIRSIWLLLLIISVCGLLSYLLFWYIKKGVLTQSVGVDELELVINSLDTRVNQSDALTKAKSLILEYSNNKAKTSILESLAAQSKQVAHDIRSPLSALSMVIGTLKDLPEEKRILIRNATQRINDIANDLLQKGKGESKNRVQSEIIQDTNLAKSIEFVPALVDILVSEKRMQYREHIGLEIQIELKNSFGAFAKINSIELKRAISNLINNSIEAFKNHTGKIIVGVQKITVADNAKIEIFINDNGKGIPSHIITQLGQMGVSHGKSSSEKSGSGLGLFHAKLTVESFGGSLDIASVEGNGTSIRIILPLAEAPAWFANTINLTGKNFLVSLDDDTSIHQIWSGRLQSLNMNHIAHQKIQSGEAFKKFVQSNIDNEDSTLYLIDFELLNQSKTGLDLIEELGISNKSILVTSRYEEIDIQRRASAISLKILPKSLAGFVPIKIDKPKNKYDAVLIDNDDLIHMTWQLVAKAKNKTIKLFKTEAEFLTIVNEIDPSTNIYIDVQLAENVNGIEVAKRIYELGFFKLYLTTGYTEIQKPIFIEAVVGKDPQL